MEAAPYACIFIRATLIVGGVGEKRIRVKLAPEPDQIYISNDPSGVRIQDYQPHKKG